MIIGSTAKAGTGTGLDLASKRNVDTALSRYLDFALKFGEEKLSKLEADAKELEDAKKCDKDEK